MTDASGFQAYNSWRQARADAWSQLEETAQQLADAVTRGDPANIMTLAVTGLLDELTPVEQYWAFPGPELLRRVRDLFTAGTYDGFAALVALDQPGPGHRVLPGGHRVVAG